MSHETEANTRHEVEPLFSFGLVADVQYADTEPRMNFEQTRWRNYKTSLHALRRAVTFWESESMHVVSFILQLGDLIDGLNAQKKMSEVALRTVLAEFSNFSGKVHHTCGNHELYNFTKSELLQNELNSTPSECCTSSLHSYYSFCPHPKFCFVMLDTFECTIIGRPTDDPVHVESLALLRKYNQNEDLNSPHGLHGDEMRFTAFNGGVSAEQLSWLDATLKKAQEDGQHVVIGGHHPVHPEASYPLCLNWNYQDILDTIHKYDCVVAYFAGHDHDGGYSCDDHGIHHLTLHGLVEAQPGTSDFGTVHVYSDKMLLEGQGRIRCLTINLPPKF